MEKFRAENERKLKTFLYYRADYWEQAYRTGADEVATTGEGGDIFGSWMRATIDNPKVRASHKVLEESVEYLKKKHRLLHLRLMPAFFNGPDSKPWLPDTWRDEAEEGSEPDKLAWEDYLKSIVYMMEYIEARLPQFSYTNAKGEIKPMLRLHLPESLPSTAITQRARPARAKRKDALKKCQEYMETIPRHLAIQLAAQHTGYSAKEIRVILRQYEKGEL
jgi:hypothetical protein